MSNRTRVVGVALLVSCLGLSGCVSAMKFASAYDSNADFTKYSTYAFRADRKIDDPDRQRLAETVINQELGAKGFKVEGSSPDLMIGLAPFASADTQGGMLAAGTVTWSYQGPYDGLAVSSGGLGYKDAELSISFTDTRTGVVVWKGIISGKLSYDDREGNYSRTIETFRKLLRGFPPPRK